MSFRLYAGISRLLAVCSFLSNILTFLVAPNLGDVALFCNFVPQGHARIVQKFISGNMNDLIKSPVGTAESAPQVLLIIFDSMFLQNRQIFFLKGLLLMMLFLIFDVVYRVVDM